MAGRLGLVLYVFSWVVGALVALLGLGIICQGADYRITGIAIIVVALLIVGIGRGVYYVLAGR